MARYRAEGETVDAIRWTGGPAQEEDPTWAREALEDGRLAIVGVPTVVEIKTPIGIVIAQQGDWIIRSSDGHLSGCPAGDFESIYQRVQ